MSGGLTSRLVQTADELRQIEGAWEALWRQARGATPFQSPAWLIAWWQAFHPGELAVNAVFQGERLVGLAPFYLERAEGRARLLGIGISISDYQDVLVAPDLERPVLAEMARAYGDAGAAWDEWELAELRPEVVALDIEAPRGWGMQESATSRCPVLAIGGEGSGLDCVPAPMRRKLRMTRNRLARGGARFLRAEERDIAWWFEALARLHGARWNARGEDGVLADRRLAQHHRAAMVGLQRLGVLRLYGVEIGGAVAGAYYGFCDDRCAYAYLGGFDPAFAYYSPGTALIGIAIEDASAQGATQFHFLRGAEAYKYAWGAKDVWNRRRVFARKGDA